MAKQGINPIERHVEKAVLGVSVLLVLFVVFSYVVSTPITVTVGGQKVTPFDLDPRLGEIADRVAQAYKNASFVPPAVTDSSGTEKAIEDLRQSAGVLDKLPVAMVPPVAWWPQVQKPESTGIGPGGAHGIASVSAPVLGDVLTGVSNVVLGGDPIDAINDPTNLGSVLQGYPSSVGAVAADAKAKDLTWAFLKMNFDMQQQYEIFRQNGYSREQANIILFMDVQVQRQRVHPDGSTGSWEDVPSYKIVTFKAAPTTVNIGVDGAVGQLDDQRIRQLFALLAGTQIPLLYPVPHVVGGDYFPPYLADGVMKPLAQDSTLAVRPAMAPGAAARPAARAAPVRRVSGGSRGGGGRGDRGGGDRGGGDRGGDRGMDPSRTSAAGGARGSAGRAPAIDPVALQAMSRADMALKQRRYTEAMQLLTQARQGGAAQNPMFAKLEAEVTAAYQAWQQKEAGRQQQAKDEGARNAEIWAYDFQALPGKTYRYRTRVVLFNVFAHPDVDRNELQNPQDGARVALTGEWSEPSQPVTIASPVRFFLAGPGTAPDTASIEVFRFQEGYWYSTRLQVGSGDMIGDVRPRTAKTPELDFRTGYAVVDIGLDSRSVVETDTGGDAVKVRPGSSMTLTYMDDDGTVQQRWSARDTRSQMKKELDLKVKMAADRPVATPPALSGGPGTTPVSRHRTEPGAVVVPAESAS